MRKKANDVTRDGWSAHTLADESGYAIDMKQKLKQGRVHNDRKRTTEAETVASRDARHTSPSKGQASRKKSSTTRRTK